MTSEQKLNKFLKSIGGSQVYYKTSPTSDGKIHVMAFFHIKNAEFVHQICVPSTTTDDFDFHLYDKLENKLAKIIYDKIVLDGQIKPEFVNGYEIEENLCRLDF